jgi:hypothetical protein
MIKKHPSAGKTWDSSTALRIPTSPCGHLSSSRPLQVHVGGQLGMPRWFKSGWSRSNMESLLCSGSPPPLTPRFKLGRSLKLTLPYYSMNMRRSNSKNIQCVRKVTVTDRSLSAQREPKVQRNATQLRISVLEIFWQFTFKLASQYAKL